MAEIRENETTENSSSTSLPPETLTGRKLDYAVNLIKDNPLDEINQNIKEAGMVDGIKESIANITFQPPFGMEMVPEETKMMMGWD